MNQTKTAEKLTAEDLMYLKFAMAHVLADQETAENMPKTYSAIGKLVAKVNLMYSQEANV
jgi:hypothetical protein